MLHPIKIVDVELSAAAAPISGLDGYLGVKALVRLHGAPLGCVDLPVTDGSCSATTVRRTIADRLAWPIISHLLDDYLAEESRASRASMADLLRLPHPTPDVSLPSVTVAVCTRDRVSDLERCLESLQALDYPNIDILVVDNAPSDDTTESLVRGTFPQVRYAREMRPGLDWARNRAIVECRGDILAYTDDDVVVDAGWVQAFASVFAEDPNVMAVTGLVIPLELESEAQVLFERSGGFGRGFERKWHQVIRREADGHPGRLAHHGAGQFGTGANMAFRRVVFNRVGPFDPALDVGTVTNGGGDLEIFFRILQEGHILVYEPNAMVRHRHRRDRSELRAQLANNGTGLYSYFVRSAQAYPGERKAFLRLGLWWFWRRNVRRLMGSFWRPGGLPRDLILAELRGSLSGLGQYPKAKRIAHGTTPLPRASRQMAESGSGALSSTPPPPSSNRGRIAVRVVDLERPVRALTDVEGYASTRVFVLLDGRPAGQVDIENGFRTISASRLRSTIVKNLGHKLLANSLSQSEDLARACATADLRRHLVARNDEAAKDSGLPDNVPVSVAVATYDRPDDLRRCLRCLLAQESRRQIEIIVVDNHPASRVTPPVVREFPGVVLVSEPRQGLAYARNKGFTTSRGDIVIATDDDVSMPSDWLEKLVAPFAETDVMVVTGNTLPVELETTAQRLFEQYGGLGRGFERREFDGTWFRRFRRSAVPTWQIGATANAAFRASVFADPEIGLMDEALGPGTPTGVGEDTYLFYKVLKCGYRIVYEPAAYVWHRHRREMPSLRRQLYAYSTGHVAYHLTTLVRDHDLRGLLQVGIHVPKWRLRRALAQIVKRQGQWSGYPMQLTLLETKGNLVGPWTLWRSRRRVRREGRSDPYVSVGERSRSSGARAFTTPSRATLAPTVDAETGPISGQ
jgi:glycosyltransferase involved in cell wall biosynthesis